MGRSTSKTTRPKLCPPAWMARHGFTAADLARFAGDLLVAGGILLARHRNQLGHEIGWEAITPGLPRPTSAYTAGAGAGSFRTFPMGQPRLVLTRGALQALAVAALEGRRTDTTYVGLGPHWGPAARDTVTDLVMRPSLQEVDHRFTEDAEDVALHARVDTHIVGLTETRRSGPLGWGWTRPASGCWLRALREARG